MKKTTLTLIGLAAMAGALSAADLTVLPNHITSDTTLTSAVGEYRMSGYTYVMSGATLTIEPGVHIYADEDTGASASALIVTRGAKIMAQGTATNPIVFEPISARTTELGPDDTGMWGGVIVCGKGILNSNKAGSWTGACTQDIEGMLPAAADEALINFGGSDNTDNSGVLSYVSIRHGGVVISEGNEINGLTLGGVGSGTTINHVEVFANKDDAIEIFGGAVNLDHCIAAFSYDDSLDLDEGYQGRVQYYLALQRTSVDDAGVKTDAGDKGGEWDGADFPNDASPYMLLKLANATFVGVGNKLSDSNKALLGTASDGAASNTAINIRSNGAAQVYNSVFVGSTKMLEIDNYYKDLSGTTQTDSAQIARYNNGDIKFAGNIWYSCTAANNTAAGLQVTGAKYIQDDTFFTGNNNVIGDPGFTLSRYPGEEALSVLPSASSIAVTGTRATVPAGSGFEQTSYAGAFPPNYNWATGWTKLYSDGYFKAEGTWFNHPKWGWLWLSSGFLGDGGYVYFQNTDQWVWIALEDASGYWTYTFK